MNEILKNGLGNRKNYCTDNDIDQNNNRISRMQVGIIMSTSVAIMFESLNVIIGAKSKGDCVIYIRLFKE